MTLGIELARITRSNHGSNFMIQWFPGHMHKASKEFSKTLPQVDLIIEILDARLPGSSENPMLAALRRNKPGIKILNKSDLSDTDRLAAWKKSLEQQDQVKTLICNSLDNSIFALSALCRSMVPVRENRSSMVYATIAGIPNVGKSTLINKLAERNVAKPGNEAAVTRMQQRIEIASDLTLIDTPGMLWANIENEASGYRLAASGAIRETAYDIQEVGSFVAEFLLVNYPQRLIQRYHINPLPKTDIEFLEALAKKRGCIVSGGRVDLEKVSRLIINELRNGDLGPVCFETPDLFAAEWARVEVIRTEKAAKKAARKANRMGK
jgi:ribosome biogenesis GTPase A